MMGIYFSLLDQKQRAAVEIQKSLENYFLPPKNALPSPPTQ